MAEDLGKKCIQLLIANKQRRKEIDAGLGMKGTNSYEIKGCYDCNGFKFECEAYYSTQNFNQMKEELKK